MLGNLICGIGDLSEQVRLRIRSSELTIKSLADKSGTPTGNIDQLADQIRINSCRKVFEVQVNVFDRRT